MIRPLAAGILVLGVAGCALGQPLPTASPFRPTPPPGSASAVPTELVRPAGTPVDLAWLPLSALDLRSGFVANGATSGSTTVLLGADAKTGALLSWTSADGAHWQRHWLDGATFGGGLPQAIVAGGPGFVALGWHLTANLGPDVTVWTSPNGVDWTPDPDVSGRFGGGRSAIAATSSSIVVATCCSRSGGPSIRTSSDGISWLLATLPGSAPALDVQVAAAGSAYLAVASLDQGNAAVGPKLGAWRSADGQTWTRADAIESSLRGLHGVNAVLGLGDHFAILDDLGGLHLVADDGSFATLDPPVPDGSPIGGPAGLMWLGAAAAGACSPAWLGGGGAWHALQPDPGVCATAPVISLAVPDGWMFESAGSGTGGETGWAVRPAGSVAAVGPPDGPVPVPPTSAIPVPPTGPLSPSVLCPTGPLTLSMVIALDANDRVACFGSRELTLRAWVVDPGVGYGGACDPATPAWLYVCVLPEWSLAPAKTGKAQLQGVLGGLKRPDASGDLKGVGRWVDVTGHFDDPAARTCQLAAGPAVVGEPPVGWFVLRCRAEFAVTRIETSH